jgi:hypothetical protein
MTVSRSFHKTRVSKMFLKSEGGESFSIEFYLTILGKKVLCRIKKVLSLSKSSSILAYANCFSEVPFPKVKRDVLPEISNL